MHRFAMIGALAVLLGVTAACSVPRGESVEEKRAFVLRMHDETLARLYAAKPEVQVQVESAPGYAVFSNVGAKVIFLSAGQGYGVAAEKVTGRKTFMRMAEVGAGLGLGVKDFRAVFVFHDAAVMGRFIDEGWDFGGEAAAAAKSGEKGGAASTGSTVRDMTVYRLTDAGLILSATVSGTKYWQDGELN